MKKAILLGAGFSYDLGMPLALELSEVFLGIFTPKVLQQLGSALARNAPYGKDRPINAKAIFQALSIIDAHKRRGEKNYEKLIAEIQKSATDYQGGVTQSDRDSNHYVVGVLYDLIHSLLCFYQEISYEHVYYANKDWFSDLPEYLVPDQATWVFTLNHDLYLEYLALDLKVPITYGDSNLLYFPLDNRGGTKKLIFSNSIQKDIAHINPGYFTDTKGINLVKLHGGLSEFHYKDHDEICNLSIDRQSSEELAKDFALIDQMRYYENGRSIGAAKDMFVTGPDGNLDILTKSMLTGENKFSGTSKTKPGEEKLKIFDDVLRQVEELTIIGYGFGDEHINFRISNAMLLNPDLSIRIVDPYIKSIPHCIKQFDFDNRIRRAMCGAAEWFTYSISERWNPEQSNSLKTNRALRQDVQKRVISDFLPYLVSRKQ